MGLHENIRRILREELLNERLTDVDQDVDMIYDKFFRDDIEKLHKTNMVSGDMFDTKIGMMTTADLVGDQAREAHKLNPCDIIINNRNLGGNYYSPNDNKIGFGINTYALKWLNQHDGDFELATISLNNPGQREMFPKEFGETKIKGSIHHELAHWIDDTLHNKHIKKRIDKQTKLNTRNLGGIPVDMTKMEIQGQIHNIKQLYNKHKDEWDLLSFNDLLKLSPTLNNIYNNLRSSDYGHLRKWVRTIKTRMYREGLLGGKMY